MTPQTEPINSREANRRVSEMSTDTTWLPTPRSLGKDKTSAQEKEPKTRKLSWLATNMTGGFSEEEVNLVVEDVLRRAHLKHWQSVEPVK